MRWCILFISWGPCCINFHLLKKIEIQMLFKGNTKLKYEFSVHLPRILHLSRSFLHRLIFSEPGGIVFYAIAVI